MRVYTGPMMLNGKEQKVILSAKSVDEAARLSGLGLKDFRRNWVACQNEQHIRRALSQPNTPIAI